MTLSFTAAQASTVFDFTSGSTGYTYGNLGYSEDGIGLDVSAGRYLNGNVIDWGKIAQINNYGLAILNGPNDNTHQIDGGPSGTGHKDVAVFQFSKAVTLESISFTFNSNNDQFALFFDIGDNGSLNLINSSLDANPTDSYEFLGALLFSGDLFGIGALHYTDDFKIASITVSGVSAVPVPAALPLFGSGLAILGFMGWRRKKRQSANA
ncbi:MAG: VPLPA-CTERM sorting domain-containing protein [Rhizobiaceae bacterium]